MQTAPSVHTEPSDDSSGTPVKASAPAGWRRLLSRVAIRMQAAAIARRFVQVSIVLAIVYGMALLLARGVGMYGEWFTPLSTLLVPAVSALIAVLFHHRPTSREAARVVDRKIAAQDLFLTAALLESSAGEYQPLVLARVESRAAGVVPANVVPFKWQRSATWMLCVLTAVAIGSSTLPTFDPFGKVAEAKQAEKQRQQLEEAKKSTEVRIAQLKKEETPEGELSEETKAAMEQLKKSFQGMRRNKPQDNLKSLMAEQKQLGNQWRKLSAEQLKNVLAQSQNAQQFGAENRERMDQWTRELQEGSTKSLQKELEQMKEDLQRLAKTSDPVERQKLKESLKERMKDLEEFASDKANSKPLAAALQRAMKQLENSKFEGMEKESAEAAEKSLELAQMELKELAQSAKDLKALEEALKAIQMAKKLNDAEQLDGETAEGAESVQEMLEQYEELYAQLMGEENEGDGEGTGDRGMGRGGNVPEDDTIDSAFKDEQAKAIVQPGKVLLSIKTKGMSDRGEAQRQYKDAVRDVQQGVNQAILQEQVPPGYHDGIKQYFDNLEPAAEPSSTPAPAGAPAAEPAAAPAAEPAAPAAATAP